MALDPKLIYYFDVSKLDRDLTGSKDIAIIFNDQALLESVMNILATEPGERIMYPEFGCYLSQYLFEPLDMITASNIKSSIEYAINKFEPRVNNLLVNVVANEDLNTFNIDIIFNMKIKSPETLQKISIKLSKVR